jgi:hypothetical protein
MLSAILVCGIVFTAAATATALYFWERTVHSVGPYTVVYSPRRGRYYIDHRDTGRLEMPAACPGGLRIPLDWTSLPAAKAAAYGLAALQPQLAAEASEIRDASPIVQAAKNGHLIGMTLDSA